MTAEAKRRRIAVLGSVVACMAAPCVALTRRFPHFVWAWIALMFSMLVYAGIEFRKMKKRDQ